jgi:hypothetical protein
MDGNEIAARLVNLKGAKAECPQCNQTKWATPEPNGRALLVIDGTVGQEIKRLVVLICDNCGFVRMHDEEKLHD